MADENNGLGATDELHIRMQSTEMAIGIMLKQIGLAAGIDMTACLDAAEREASALRPHSDISEPVSGIISRIAEQLTGA